MIEKQSRPATLDDLKVVLRSLNGHDVTKSEGESPYAADIAYYLGKHPEQSGSIALMQPEQARLAVQQIEASVAANNPIRK